MSPIRLFDFSLPVLFFISWGEINAQSKKYIEQARLNFEPAYFETEPEQMVISCKIPFEAPDRFKFSSRM